MTNKIMDNIYNSVEIIDEIRELDQTSYRLKLSASMYVEDLGGEDTLSTLSFKTKDMKSVKQDLTQFYKELEEETSSPINPLQGLFGQISAVPTDKEYQIHGKHTDQLVLHLDPSESLRILEHIVTILNQRREKLVGLLKDTFPAELKDL